MFKLKKKTNLYEEQKVLAAIAGSIDELERYEASEDALGAGLMTTLKTLGHSEEKALTASLMTVKALEGEFSKMYWQEQTFSHKVAVFVAIIKTAENAIAKNNLKPAEAIVALALEEIKNGRTKTSDK